MKSHNLFLYHRPAPVSWWSMYARMQYIALHCSDRIRSFVRYEASITRLFLYLNNTVIMWTAATMKHANKPLIEFTG